MPQRSSSFFMLAEKDHTTIRLLRYTVVSFLLSALTASTSWALGPCNEQFNKDIENFTDQVSKVANTHNKFMHWQSNEATDQELPHRYVDAVLYGIIMYCLSLTDQSSLHCAQREKCRDESKESLMDLSMSIMGGHSVWSEKLQTAINLMSRHGKHDMAKDLESIKINFELLHQKAYNLFLYYE